MFEKNKQQDFKTTAKAFMMIGALVGSVLVIAMAGERGNLAYAETPEKLKLKGHISSIQTYDSGEPFMLSGPFDLKINGEKSSVKSTFTMVGIDGEHYHKMILKDFKLSNLDENTVTGTIDVYGKHGDAPAFVLADDAPVTIEILNDVVFTINIDKDAVHGHFGNNPMYGEVIKLK
jgi:hypothetical protein